MKLSELIAAYGDDAVQFQNLDECFLTLNMSGGKSKITFGTEQPVWLNGPEKLGLIVWLDRERVAEIIAKAKGGAA
ncbi:MAG: hypothetical protein AB7L41_04605 [Flavobacteriaceae bacterium]